MRQCHSRVGLLFCQLLLVLLVGSIGAQQDNGGRRNDQRGLYYSPKYYHVEQIACPSDTYKTFESWMAIQLDGELRPHSSDEEDLGILLLQAFRARSALNCDPLQRALKAASFHLYGFDNGWAIYKVQAISYGSNVPPVLEPVPPYYLTFDKNPLGPVCSLSDIENHYMHVFDSSGHCPFLGCYCPTQLLPASVKTAGLTEVELAETLDAAVEQCQDVGNSFGYEDDSRGGDDFYYHGGSGKGDSGKKSAGYGKGGKGGGHGKGGDHGGGRRECLPLVVEIDAVKELTPVEPCPKRRSYDADYIAVITEDPCELGEHAIRKFLDELVSLYNEAQFETCDSSFRRILDYSLFENLCNHDHKPDYEHYYGDRDDGYGHRERRRLYTSGFPSPFGITVSTTNQTSDQVTNDEGNQGRRRRELLEQKYMEILTRGSRSRGAMADANGGMATHSRKLNDDRLYDNKNDCFCSAFSNGPSDGISSQDFLELAQAAMYKVTHGRVSVLELFRVNEGCPEGKRKPIRGGATVCLNVDAKSLRQEEICQLEQDCVLTYNNYVMEFCPPSYTQIRSCEIRPFYVPKAHSYGRGEQYCEKNGMFVSLIGDSTCVDGMQDPTIDDYRRMLFSPPDGASSSVSLHQRTWILQNNAPTPVRSIHFQKTFAFADSVPNRGAIPLQKFLPPFSIKLGRWFLLCPPMSITVKMPDSFPKLFMPLPLEIWNLLQYEVSWQRIFKKRSMP